SSSRARRQPARRVFNYQGQWPRHRRRRNKRAFLPRLAGHAGTRGLDWRGFHHRSDGRQRNAAASDDCGPTAGKKAKAGMTKILIIDDHPIVRRGVRDLLRDRSDLQVSEAANGPDALALLRREPFDLILLDLDLPGMDGLDVLKQIKREHKRAPVLVLSLYPE